eukprot:CAMPEP_0185729604 /NCGR_PEP_ID=MMETSP1171-20130828/6525_1 /TAXON_ID=374046 /ORGANISM="Helicotheca tamensis, Strain CCMP826" /LENGTH=372 /DNA_ID=CAMNT_0028398483 /DNA_START=1 /DNA_END=1116 /DNA_ORIENTATION=+
MPCQRRNTFRIGTFVVVKVLVLSIFVNIYFSFFFIGKIHRNASFFDDVTENDCTSPTTGRPPRGPTNQSSGRCDPSDILVAIKSGGSNQRYRHRRNLWRNSICAHNYQQYGIQYRFMIGLPIKHNIDINGHNQAARDTSEEIDDALALRNESKTFRDIQILPIRDIYEELYLKTIHVLDWLNQEARGPLVVIHDDEYCASVDELLSLCHEAVSDVDNSHIFAGTYLWSEAKYEEQRAFDGSFSPYFSGAILVFSTDLIKNVMEDEDTMYAGIWASHAEDLQVGRWVDKQNKLNETAPVRIIERPKLLVTVPEPIIINIDKLKTCKPIQTSAQCMKEAIYLGEFSAPDECAKLTAGNPACTDTFMFSSTQLDW